MQVTQPQFINLNYLVSVYLVFLISFGSHLANLLSFDFIKKKEFWVQTSFYVDSLLISYLISKTGFNQSLFLFLNLINIMFYGFLYHKESAITLSIVTAISFNFSTLFVEDIKGIQLILFILLNNLAFFAVAYLSGAMSDQLSSVSKELGLQKILFNSLSDKNKFIVQNIPTGLITLTQTGVVLQSNPAAERILSGVNLTEKNIFQVLNHFSFSKMGSYFDYNYQIENQFKTLQIKLSPSKEQESDALLMLIEDVTELRRYQEQLRQSEKLAAIGQLAAGIAHEIRNPLTGISGSVQMLSQTHSNPDDKKLMSIILKEIDRLNNLITEFLEYAKPMKLNLIESDLKSLVYECVNQIKTHIAFSAECEVVLNLQEGMNVQMDSQKMKQVLLNVFINGLQAMEHSSVKKLFVTTGYKAEQAFISIRDTGSGMSETVKNRIFEAFYTTKSKGTGLGMAMSFRILEQHQILTEIISEPEKGTEFIFKFKN